MIALEVCCGSYEDAVTAEHCGASRIELNSALELGGLTPDNGTLCLCKEELTIPVMAMLRPRAGGFCYTQAEFCAMQKSAEQLLAAGADGLVFGILTPERQVDAARTKILTNLAHACGREAVFHRAFDCTTDLLKSAEILAEIGVDRILTSGGAETACEGGEMLRLLQTQFGKKIEILPGCGVRKENVCGLLKATGVSQVHSSCKGMQSDFTAHGNTVSFAVQEGENWHAYACVDGAMVRQMCHELKRLEGDNTAF